MYIRRVGTLTISSESTAQRASSISRIRIIVSVTTLTIWRQALLRSLVCPLASAASYTNCANNSSSKTDRADFNESARALVMQIISIIQICERSCALISELAFEHSLATAVSRSVFWILNQQMNWNARPRWSVSARSPYRVKAKITSQASSARACGDCTGSETGPTYFLTCIEVVLRILSYVRELELRRFSSTLSTDRLK